MIKKLFLALLVLFVVGAGALALWARSVFTGDNVRATLAAQLSEALGQPVTVGSVAASAYPRVTIDLGDVGIGQPARVQIASLHFGTDFRALLSRRIEHADVRVNTVRVELPLPTLGGRPAESSGTSSPTGGGEPPVTLVSVDEVAIRDVTIVSGGRTLKVDIEAVPTAAGLTLKRVTIATDDTAIEATGEITDLAGPVGTLTIKAGQMDFDRLIAFLGDFASGSGISASSSAAAGAPSPRPTPANLVVTMEADRAKSGAIALDKLTGRAVVTDAGVTLDPIAFGIFGGRYQGTLSTSMGSAATAPAQPPAFKGTATLSGIDMAALTTFAGTPGTITGRLNGSIDLTGTGSDLAAAMKSVRGMARLDIADGVIRHLQLVRTIVLATSMRKESTEQAVGGSSGGEAFKRLAATLAIAGQHAQTNDLQLDSRDVTLTASGRIALDGSAIELTGRVQLSPELSAQAGRDLLRYTADNGRVTLPATVTGSADKISVSIDVADATKRAVRNRAVDEAQKAIGRNIGSLFKRKPPK